MILSEVVEFAKATIGATGSPPPQVVLSSVSNSLSGAWGLAFDAGGDLWIGAFNVDSIVEFNPNQIAISGAPTPVVTMPRVTNFAYQMTFGPSF